MSNPSLVLNAANDISFEDYKVPDLKDDHLVIVEVKRTGICGSDIHYYTDGKIGEFELTSPMVLGHESSGIVHKVGKSVTTVQVGDKVAIEPGVPLRLSDAYKSGHYNLCPHMLFAATPSPEGVPNPPGTLCKYFELPQDFLVKLPDHISLDLGALVEPLSVGVHANRLAGTRFGDRVAVLGAGPVGLLAAAAARAFGATAVLASDIADNKLELAKLIGAATHVYNSKEGDVKALHEAFDGHAPTVILECSGVPPSVRLGVLAAAKGARYVQVGIPAKDVPFPMAEVGNKEMTVLGLFRYAYGDYQNAVDILSENYREGGNKVVDYERIITSKFPFKDAIKAYDHVKEGKAVKCIIEGPE